MIHLTNHHRKIYEYDEFYYVTDDRVPDHYEHIRRRVGDLVDWEYIAFVGDYQEWIAHPKPEELEEYYQLWKKLN